MNECDDRTIRLLFDDYLRRYASRDDGLTEFFSENFSGFTGGGDFLVKTRQDWVAITRQDFAQVKDPLQIELKDLALQSLSETVAVATGFFSINLPIKDQLLSRETARLVLIFCREPSGWKISHSSISIPYGLVREGEVYPLSELEVRNRYLEDLVSERTAQLSEANEQLKETNRKLAQEVEEHRQAEVALRANKQQFDNLAARISVGVYILHSYPDGAFALDYVSPKMADILGLPDGTTLDDYQDFFRWVHPEDQAEFVRLNQEGIIHGTPMDWQGRIVVAGAIKWVHVKSSPEPLGNGEVLWHGVVADITDRKQVEEERLRLDRLLFHTQKLESLGVLAGGIAHDFNNILMAVLGNASLAMTRIGADSPVGDNLRRIEQAAERAADLTKQMLAYSGKGRFVVQNLNLNLLIDNILHLLDASISKKASVRLDLHRPLPMVEGDAAQLNQVIMNLVINASEALQDGSGIISIATGSIECSRDYLTSMWLDESIREGIYVYLEVADTGCGMDENTLARLFDPFFTTKFTGRGLGMAAVQGIVKGHKGSIKVASEPGLGTTFRILLPVSTLISAADGHQIHGDYSDDWKGSGTVLLVDDEEGVRCIGVEMLKLLGFTPVTANDGEEALRIFTRTPEIAFVLLDLTMPHMDGEQCFQALRARDPEVKIIMTSGYNEQDVNQKFLGKDFSGFIQKPYSLSELRSVVRTIA